MEWLPRNTRVSEIDLFPNYLIFNCLETDNPISSDTSAEARKIEWTHLKFSIEFIE